jgi:hypothetical protein
MNVELVAQMFKNYQSNVLFHLEGMFQVVPALRSYSTLGAKISSSHGELERAHAGRTVLMKF